MLLIINLLIYIIEYLFYKVVRIIIDSYIKQKIWNKYSLFNHNTLNLRYFFYKLNDNIGTI